MELIYIKALCFLGSLLAAGVLAYLETAFTAMRLYKVKELKAQTKRYTRLLECWEQNPQRILVTILIANNLAHVLCSVTITDIMQNLLGDTGLALAVGVMLATILILFLGEIIPKTFAKSSYDEVSGPTLWLINALFILFAPIVSLCMRITRHIIAPLVGTRKKGSEEVTEKEIQFLITYGDKLGVLEGEKTEMLQNVFSLGETTAKEIMIPETDMIRLDVNSSVEEAMEIFIKYRFTRIPLYEGKEANLIGLLHQKDVFEDLYKKESKSLREMAMPVLFVPETKRINQLMREFLKKRIHMAILIDEHGAVMGLVTLEDIIEEIIGEISDEHELVQEYIVPLKKGGWLMNARVTLEEVEEILGITFEVEDSVTLGGFLAERLQHLPKKGERLHYGGYCFQIQRAGQKRVHQVLVFEDAQSGKKQASKKKV